MAVRPAGRPTNEPSAVNTPVMIAAAVVVVLFIGFLAFHFLGPRGIPRPSAPVSPDLQWISQKAQESGGNFSRLSPADQQKLFQMRGSSAPQVLQAAYQPQKK